MVPHHSMSLTNSTMSTSVTSKVDIATLDNSSTLDFDQGVEVESTTQAINDYNNSLIKRLNQSISISSNDILIGLDKSICNCQSDDWDLGEEVDSTLS